MASAKPEVISRVLLERIEWDALATEHEGKIPFDASAEHTDELRRQVAAGTSTACAILRDGQRIGLAVVRVEEDRAREFVIVAVFCDTPPGSRPLTHELQDALEAMARAQACQTIRFHTIRPAAVHLAATAYGYRLAEVVMRKDLPASS